MLTMTLKALIRSSGLAWANSFPDLMRPTYNRIQITPNYKPHAKIRASKKSHHVSLSGFFNIVSGEDYCGIAR